MVGRRFSRWVSLSLPLILVLALSCGGSNGDTPVSDAGDAPAESTASAPETPTITATAAPQAANQPGPSATIEPDGARIHKYVSDLAETIGPRPPGSASEKAAADYLAGKLRSFGYEVELQPFPISTEASRQANLDVRSSEPATITSVPFEGSAAGSVNGSLVAVPGVGAPSDFPPDARGAIVVVERGQLQFREKIANASAAGATGIIIFNNESGGFYGTIGGTSSIPAVSVSQAEGQRLRDLIARGGATAALSVDAAKPATSHNVVAKPPGRDCEVISGGHYDSVQVAPGANDNASGTATVLELAALTANKGQMGGNCFVLFGAEEIGLVGSRAYVDSLSPAARSRLKAMLNFDMVGVGDQSWQLIGSAALQEKASELAAGLSMPVVRSSSAGTGAGSDHASFIQAGVPALFLHRTQDAEWHQPGDRAVRVLPEHLETAARLGMALLESLAGGA